MCGIAGLIHRNGSGNIGQEMTQMLQSLKHRGPDSTGYAIYGTPGRNEFVMRFKVAEQEDMAKGFDIIDEVKRRRAKVEERLSALGVQIIDKDDVTEYAYRYRIQYDGDMKKLADYVEDVEGTEILSMGNALELIKDLGDAARVAEQYDDIGDIALRQPRFEHRAGGADRITGTPWRRLNRGLGGRDGTDDLLHPGAEHDDGFGRSGFCRPETDEQ